MISKKNQAGYKLAGATVVFLAAVIQVTQTDAANRRLDLLDQAFRDEALIDKGALIHQTSMYVLHGDIAVPDRAELLAQHASLVALKLYQARFVAISTLRGGSKEERAQDLEMLRRKIGDVTDVRSLSDYMKLTNAIAAKYTPALSQERDQIRSSQAIWRIVYLCLYLLGGGLAFVGGWMEWKLAAEPEVKSASPRGRPG